MRDGYTLIDVDNHFEEPELFTERWAETYLDEPYRLMRPRRVTDNVVGGFRWMWEGVLHPKPSGKGCGFPTRVNVQSMLAAEKVERGEITREQRVQQRVAALDTEGIDVALLTPGVPGLDPTYLNNVDASVHMCRAYNNWMADYAKLAPDRFLITCILPLQDMDAALEELNRAVTRLGAKAVAQRPNPLSGRNWGDRYYDPLYAELSRLGVPLAFHEATDGYYEEAGAERFDDYILTHTLSHPMEITINMVDVVYNVFPRFPELKVVWIEMGCALVPYWLHRMDTHFHKLRDQLPQCEMPPSEYFKRQGFIGVEPYHDPNFDFTVEKLGDDNLIFTSDYPHWDALKPGEMSRDIVESTKISDATKRKILSENILRLVEGAQVAV